uniref:Ig-like domain-containing protein n=1 Tax=Anopheles farauti TaxID=69004 RepID=A0A182Q8G2_9DIPT
MKDVRVSVPVAIRRGDNANLICHYDMEGAELYSVKWYKGKREFFRYTPKEIPALKSFFVAGLSVEVRAHETVEVSTNLLAGNGPQAQVSFRRPLSNGSHLTLMAVESMATGKYSCEVSADLPSFDTMIVSSEMEVVDVPVTKPLITGIRQFYRIGDVVLGNCTSYNSKPAANLTWLLDDKKINETQTTQYPVYKELQSGLDTSTLGLVFHLSHHFLGRSKMKFSCVAKIHDVYEQRVDRWIEDERPKLLAASASPVGLNPVNYVHSIYDQSSAASSYHHHDGSDFDNQNSDAYMTQIQGDMSSSAPSAPGGRIILTLGVLHLVHGPAPAVMQIVFSILTAIRSVSGRRAAAGQQPKDAPAVDVQQHPAPYRTI